MALLPRIATLGGTFIVNDETLYWTWSNEFISALVNLDWRGTLVGKGYPAVTIFWVHGLGILVRFILETLQGQPMLEFWQRAALDQPLIFELLGQRRLAMGVVNAALILLIFFQAQRLMGVAIAFLGAGLMAFAPFLLADARTMRGDALMSSLMLLSVLFFLVFLYEKRWLHLIFSAMSLALAILTKITAIPVAGFTVLAMGFYLLRSRGLNRPTRWRWGIVSLAIWAGTTLLTTVALWPALWVAPFEVFNFIRNYAADSIDGRLNYFWGRLTHAESLTLFYPSAFLFRATPLVVLGIAVIAVLVILSVWRIVQQLAKGEPGERQIDSRPHLLAISSLWSRLFAKSPVIDKLWWLPIPTRWTLLALGTYTVIYWLVLNAGALKRDRYLMPVFPATMFIAAAGLLWLFNWACRRWPGSNLPSPLSGGRWTWGVLVLLIGWQLSHTLSTHPFYYTYWSPLMGGGRVAQYVMMAESGVETSALVDLSRRSNVENETVALLYTRDFAPAYDGETVRLANHTPWVTADRVLLRQYHYQTEKLDPHLVEYLSRKPPERIVEFQGYTWAWIYPGPAAQYYAGSMLEGKTALLGYNLSSQTVSLDNPLHLKLFWRNKGYQPPENIFVRLVDADGFVWAETIAQPLPEFEAMSRQYDAYIEGQALLQILPGTPPALYFLKIGLTGGDDAPDLGEFSLSSEGDKIVVEKPITQTLPPVQRFIDERFGSNLTLLGVDLESPLILNPPTPRLLTLYWQADTDISEDYTIVIRLLDTNEKEVAHWSGPPTRGLYPSSSWGQGELIRDPWMLDLTAVDSPNPIAPGRYRLEVALYKPKSEQDIGPVSVGHVEIIDRQRRFTLPVTAKPIDVQLGEAISLSGYELDQVPLTGGARFSLKLYWQTKQPLSTDYTVFTQILGPDGTVVGQHDGIPAEGMLPTTAWDVGEVVSDPHRIEMSITQSGEYRLIVGMYDPHTGQRLAIAGDDDWAMGDFLQLHTFTSEAMR